MTDSDNSGFNIWQDNKSMREADSAKSPESERYRKNTEMSLNLQRLKTLKILQKNSNASSFGLAKPQEPPLSPKEDKKQPASVASPIFESRQISKKEEMDRKVSSHTFGVKVHPKKEEKRVECHAQPCVVQLSITRTGDTSLRERIEKLRESLSETSHLEQRVADLEKTMEAMVRLLEDLVPRMPS